MSIDKVEEGLTPEQYKRAIDVQDACNLSAVVHDFSNVMKRVWVEARKNGKGTAWVNQHPVAVMYSSKISSLTGSEASLSFRKSYAACIAKSKGLDVDHVG